jgi:hypothetical protein
MALIGIWNVWSDSSEHLEDSISIIRDELDFVVCVNQLISNWGEVDNSSTIECQKLEDAGLVDSVINFNPTSFKYPAKSELSKRRMGLEYAKEKGFDYFVMLDCDEFYDPEIFRKDFEKLKTSEFDGMYAKIQTYFKTKELMFENYDNYFVPFIHRLSEKTNLGFHYPVRTDPTRGVNTKKVFECESVMQHLSWVRNDITKKINNSSAKKNIKPSILQDYKNAKEGYYVDEIFRMKLIKSKFFNK